MPPLRLVILLRRYTRPPGREYYAGMGDIRLVVGLDGMSTKIRSQIEKGRVIQSLSRKSSDEVQEYQDKYFSWSEYTSALLNNSFEVKGAMTLSPANEFGAPDVDTLDLKFGPPKTAQFVNVAVTSALEKKLRVLESIHGRLEIWAESTAPVDRQAMGDAIFLVHGHDHEAREYVRGFLERTTSRDIIVLDEKAGSGSDVLGKLLTHAQSAAYAVVLLTGDDEGKLLGSRELQRRARQNVILELGLFIGLLGRNRVLALHESGVEIPSDYLGVNYVPLDEYRAWRISLVQELRAAGIEASLDRTL